MINGEISKQKIIKKKYKEEIYFSKFFSKSNFAVLTVPLKPNPSNTLNIFSYDIYALYRPKSEVERILTNIGKVKNGRPLIIRFPTVYHIPAFAIL